MEDILTRLGLSEIGLRMNSGLGVITGEADIYKMKEGMIVLLPGHNHVFSGGYLNRLGPREIGLGGNSGEDGCYTLPHRLKTASSPSAAAHNSAPSLSGGNGTAVGSLSPGEGPLPSATTPP